MSEAKKSQQLSLPLVYPKAEQIAECVTSKTEPMSIASAKVIRFRAQVISFEHERVLEEKKMLLEAAKQLEW